MMGKPRRVLRLPHAGGKSRIDARATATVVGGGIAGIAAATVLAERGIEVTLVERESFLGGRAGAWTDRLEDGTEFEMERGFHAFFRQYYNLQALLRRIAPDLGFLVPLEDYPILGPDGQVQSFSGLPRRTPWNVMTLTLRSPAIRLRDLLRVNARRAMEMLTFDLERTYDRRDAMSAGEYLDSLRFPPEARRLLFDVFAHSFFNPEREMSAGELLMMFHFYFTGNPEGLIFDVANAPFSKSIWGPMGDRLREHAVSLVHGETARSVHRLPDRGWRVTTDSASLDADAIVLAVTVPALQEIVAASPDLEDPGWRTSIESLALTNPFAVWRIWLDRPSAPGRSPFVGTTGLGPIDNISIYELFEDESRAWAERKGGSVVELHAYAIDPGSEEAALKKRLLDALHRLYPETRDARILEERFFIRQDCPAFAPGSHERRPGVDTPFPGISIAGDFVKLPIPSALMERAAASGFLAANRHLAELGVEPEPLYSISPRGIFSRFRF
jgi:isorenieratene synthase